MSKVKITLEHYEKVVKKAMDLHPYLTINGSVHPLEINRKQLERAALLNPKYIGVFITSIEYLERLKPFFRSPMRIERLAEDVQKEMKIKTEDCHGIIFIAAMYVRLGVLSDVKEIPNIVFWDRTLNKDNGDAI